MAAKKTFSYHLPGDRPSTPPDLPSEDNKHPHPLKANPPNSPSKLAQVSTSTVGARRLPANPPSTPENLSGACSQSPSPSPRPMPGRLNSPLSPPATPPLSPRQTQREVSFKFSKQLMQSKKLSSSVHGGCSSLMRHTRSDSTLGTLTQPVVYDLSDDDRS